MSKISLILLLLVTKTLVAQIEKPVADFTKVTSFDQIDVLLIPSNENKVLLNGKNSEIVELVNNDGELKIRMPLTNLMKGDAVSATVYYKKLEAIEANEGSSIACETSIKTTSFEVIVKEGSTINLHLDVASLKLKITDGSKVNIEGKAQNQDVLINTGSIYKAEKLITNQTTITANAGGEAFIYAIDSVDAKVRAGGKITIFGKPKQLNKKIIAGGKIYEKED